MNKIQETITNAYGACAHAREVLLQYFPIGSEVRFKIMHGQKNWSTGTVVDTGDTDSLKVLHHEAKEHSRYKYRTVYYTNVEGWDQ